MQEGRREKNQEMSLKISQRRQERNEKNCHSEMSEKIN